MALNIVRKNRGSEHELTHELPILGDFWVTVRHLTADDLQDLGDECTVLRGGRIGRQREFDFQRWLEKAPEYYVTDWHGLTVDVVRKLGIVLDSAKPTTNGVGEIPFDLETLRQLWRYADVDEFRNKITDFADQLAKYRAKADEAKKKDSDSSPVSSA